MLRRSSLLLLLLGCAILVSFPLIRSSRSQGTNYSVLLDGTSATSIRYILLMIHDW